jgi:hypothetical protein
MAAVFPPVLDSQTLVHYDADSFHVLLALVQLAGGTLSAPVAPAPVEHQKSSRIGLRLFVFVEVTEKKQFPISCFSGGWNLALGSGKRRSRRKNCASEDQELGL